MPKKLYLTASLILCSVISLSLTIGNSFSGRGQLITNYNFVNGDAVSTKPGNIDRSPGVNFSEQKFAEKYDNINGITVTNLEITDPGTRTIYDYQSNATVRQLVQDPNWPANLYAVWMYSPNAASGYPNRSSKLFESNDAGNSWMYVTDVPPVRSGYPSIGMLSNGCEMVCTHTTDGGITGGPMSVVYVDAAGGAGSFTELKPTQINPGDDPVWGRIIGTSSVNNARKIVLVASALTEDSAYTDCSNSIVTNSWTGFLKHGDISNAESYAISRGQNGTIGIVYVGDYTHNASDLGKVFLIESTNDGLSWGARQTVWNANFNTDSIGCIRSVDICYNGNTPNIIMGLTCMDPASGGFFLAYKCRTVFWSPLHSGGVIIDTCSNMTGSNPQADVLFSSSRGVIGMSSDSLAIYAAWCRARTETGSNGNNFFDIYFSYSADNGATWIPKVQVSNVSTGPVRDCRYVSISQSNALNGPNHVANLTYQQDSIPGSQVQGAAPSFARFIYSKVTINGPLVGIHPSETSIPDKYNLSQNYPNPFNPGTIIKFDLPEDGFVTLKVYDVTGRLVSVLINENLASGKKEYNWNAAELPSGVYFYTINAGAFNATRKMVLIK